ncbi:unnamed protein product [Meganyctiphanes norvegica]|uniref:Uncharacterized protein n=1 Tax=Meganyctiphanes norvegica TaxID=48144 RepID=A0AAV2Q1E9_MEGNR
MLTTHDTQLKMMVLHGTDMLELHTHLTSIHVVCGWRAGGCTDPPARMLGWLVMALLVAMASSATVVHDTHEVLLNAPDYDDTTDAADNHLVDHRVKRDADYDNLVIDADDELLDVSKRDLEFNQYVPGYRLRGEPSCEQLRTMWRMSKREARRATTTNQLPRSRPYVYGRPRYMAFAPSIQAQPAAPVYGSMLNYPKSASSGSAVPQKDSFNKLRGMLGPRKYSFTDVRTGLAGERGPYDSGPAGKLEEVKQILYRERQAEAAAALRPVAQALRMDMAPRYSRGGMAPEQGFVGALMPADQPRPQLTPWQPPQPDPSRAS